MGETAAKPDVRVRRVYDQPSPGDGRRFLVDRLWPRGLRTEAARLDGWVKEVAPSDGLRRWYGHEPARFAEFGRRYADELRQPERAAALAGLNEAARHGTITLLTAARDAGRSQAALLAAQLRAANRAGPGAMADAQDDDAPGDPACWLHRVCPECGTAPPADPPTTCPQCHAAIPRT